MKEQMKLETCQMGSHYLGKVMLDGETVILEPFREFSEWAAAVGSGADPAELAEPMFARIREMEMSERRAWLLFLQGIAQVAGAV